MTPRDPNTRERGRRLLSRINRWTIAAAVGLAGAFSVVAAESTRGKATGSTTTLQQPSQTPSSGSSSTSSGSAGSTSSSSGSSGVVSGGS